MLSQLSIMTWVLVDIIILINLKKHSDNLWKSFIQTEEEQLNTLLWLKLPNKSCNINPITTIFIILPLSTLKDIKTLSKQQIWKNYSFNSKPYFSILLPCFTLLPLQLMINSEDWGKYLYLSRYYHVHMSCIYIYIRKLLQFLIF